MRSIIFDGVQKTLILTSYILFRQSNNSTAKNMCRTFICILFTSNKKIHEHYYYNPTNTSFKNETNKTINQKGKEASHGQDSAREASSRTKKRIFYSLLRLELPPHTIYKKYLSTLLTLSIPSSFLNFNVCKTTHWQI